jgi:hypothetical protein
MLNVLYTRALRWVGESSRINGAELEKGATKKNGKCVCVRAHVIRRIIFFSSNGNENFFKLPLIVAWLTAGYDDS